MASLEDLSLEQRDELALLMKELSDNPETRKEALRLTRKVRPNLTIPELDIEDRTDSAISASEQRIMKLESQIREKEAREELNKRRTSLKEKGLAQSDEDIEAHGTRQQKL